MWVLLTQLIVLGPEQVHPQNGVNEEHEEQQAAHIEDSWQGAQQGVEQGPQTPADHSLLLFGCDRPIAQGTTRWLPA